MKILLFRQEEDFEVEIEESQDRVLKEKFMKNVDGKKSITGKYSTQRLRSHCYVLHT